MYRFSTGDFQKGETVFSIVNLRARRVDGIPQNSLMQGFCESPFSSGSVVV